MILTLMYHIVDRRIDVEAAVVDQVHRRRGRNARRRRGNEFAQLAVDLRHHPGEGRAQHGLVEQRALQRQVGLGLANLHLLRGAGQLRQARLGLGLVEALERGQLAFTQVLQAAVIALVQLGLAAQLLALAAAYLETCAGLLDPRLAVVLAQAHEHLAELDVLAFVDQQLADLAADVE